MEKRYVTRDDNGDIIDASDMQTSAYSEEIIVDSDEWNAWQTSMMLPLDQRRALAYDAAGLTVKRWSVAEIDRAAGDSTDYDAFLLERAAFRAGSDYPNE